jgi:alcohol dehydrogenase
VDSRNALDLAERPAPTARAGPMMKALVYEGFNQIALRSRPRPILTAPTDAIVRMVKTTICDADLRILAGGVDSCRPGRILGHEGVGVIDQVGGGVRAFRPGDRVVISSISACGRCGHCREQRFSRCVFGGWILGNAIDGTQAEFVLTPFADTSLHRIQSGDDEDALVMLSEILPTGFECGALGGRIAPAGTVAIVGAGAMGLAALLTAKVCEPGTIIAIDWGEDRLAAAARFGATHTVNSHGGEATAAVLAITGGRGADTVIETTGLPETLELCERIVAPGGVIASLGGHGKAIAPRNRQMWDRDVSVTARQVDASCTATLLKILRVGVMDPAPLISHHFRLEDILEAYDTLARADDTGAIKVIIAI